MGKVDMMPCQIDALRPSATPCLATCPEFQQPVTVTAECYVSKDSGSSLWVRDLDIGILHLSMPRFSLSHA